MTYPNHPKNETELDGLQPAIVDPFQELGFSSYKDLLNKRILLINGPIKEDIVEKAIVPILDMAQDKQPIQVWLNSNGGSLEDGQAVVDVLKSISNPIVTIVFGKAMSAAFDIFLAGDLRIMYPNALLMVHSGSTTLGIQTLSAVNKEAELHMSYFKRWAKFYASRTKITEEEWLSILNTSLNRYFFADEALQKGLAHKVVAPASKNLKNLKNIKW